MDKKIPYPELFVRFALALTMLSAVADRFGLWGANSAWGNWANFEQYTAQLTFFLPPILSTFSAYAATFLEIILPISLIIGFKPKITAILTGALLLVFAVTMSISLGVKAPFDYSVWIGSAAAFLLASRQEDVKNETGARN